VKKKALTPKQEDALLTRELEKVYKLMKRLKQPWYIDEDGLIRCAKGDCPLVALARALHPKTSKRLKPQDGAGASKKIGITRRTADVVMTAVDLKEFEYGGEAETLGIEPSRLDEIREKIIALLKPLPFGQDTIIEAADETYDNLKMAVPDELKTPEEQKIFYRLVVQELAFKFGI
jgi:hypothetical protein